MASNTRQPELSEIKTVNILGFQNHNLNIKIDKLQEIFFGIKQPVAIISVAGAMRKGKSFMLNMLLHHLLKWNLNSRNPTGDEIIRNVFQCKGGNERVTIGINITDKPIILMNKVGEEVAVFLMDSEGLFDKKQSAKQCSTVFAISTLLSSLQIFNVSEQIQECDLQYLQMFTNYTKLSAAHIGHSKAFPELLFLIRNYQLEDVWGVEEGQRYLEKFLQSDVEENQRVREVLGENFAHLRCFLLPHPGETVAKWKQTRQMWKPRKESKPNICFADINNKDFVAGVEELAEQLFGKEHLIVKKLCGDVITATEFIDLVPLYVKVFTGDDIPTPETITKVQNQCMFITKLRKLESEYCTAMSREVVDEYIPLEKLEDIHTKQLTQALKVLDSFSVILREDESKAERKYMEKRLQSAFHEIQTRNIAHKKKQIIEIKQCGEKAAELFRGWLKEAANGQYVEDISEERNVAKQKAFEAFNKCVQVYDKDLVKEYVSNLKKYIQSEDDQFIRKNAERLKSLTEKLKKKISCAAGAYMEIIENSIEDPDKAQMVNFNELHQVASDKALQVFEEAGVNKTLKCRQDALNTLKTKVEQLASNYQKRLEKYKETGKLLKVVKKAVQEYDTHFGKLEDLYLEKEEMGCRNQKATNAAMAVVKNLIEGHPKYFIEQCEWIVQDKLGDRLDSLHKQNKFLQEKANAKFKETRRGIVEQDFVKAFEDVKLQYVDDEELKTRINIAMAAAMEKYQDCKGGPEKEFLQNKQQLKQDLENHRNKVNKTNDTNKENINEKLDLFYVQVTTDYVTKMNEITSARCTSNLENLKKVHDKFVTLVTDEMEKAIPYKSIATTATKTCCDELDNQWKFIETGATVLKIVKESVINVGATSAAIGGVAGLPGMAVFGVAGTLIGAGVGLVKAALPFRYKLSIDDIPALEYLKSLKL